MDNIEDSTQLSGKTETELVQTNSNFETQATIRRKSFDTYHVKRQSKLFSLIASQLANIPIFAEELSKHGEIALDISQELTAKLASGEITFGAYAQSGQKYAQFINAETKRIYTNIPIKDLPVTLGPAIATAGLSMKLQEITHELDILGEKVDRVNRNFDLNRYAEVQSAKEKIEMALLTKNPETKKALLLDSLTQSTNAKNLLLNQLLETKAQLTNAKTNGKIPFFNNSLSAAEGDNLAMIALENLSYMKDAFNFQLTTLFELGEFDALNYIICEFKEIILQDFSGQNALFLDEHLAISTNPFKFLSNDIVTVSNALIDFIESNEELLDVTSLPDLLEVTNSKEMTHYGNESL